MVWNKTQRQLKKFFLRNPSVKKILLGLVVYVFLVAFLSSSILPKQLDVEVGEESPKTVYATRDVIDTKATDDDKEKAALSVPDMYSTDHRIEEDTLNELNTVFSSFRAIRAEEELNSQSIAERLQEFLGNELGEKLSIGVSDLKELVLSVSDEELTILQQDVTAILESVFEEGVISTNAGIVLIQHYVSSLDRPLIERSFIERLAVGVFRPNQSRDEEATDAARKKARESVEPVYIRKGDVVIRQGQLVSERVYLVLQELGMLSPKRHLTIIAGTALYVLMIMVALVLYLIFFEPEIYDNLASLGLLAVIMLLTIVLSRFVMTLSGYLMPAATAAILIAVLLSSRVAVISSVMISLVLIIITRGQMEFAAVLLLGSLAAIYSMARMRRRTDLLRSGISVALVNSAAILSLSLVQGTTSWVFTIREISYGFFGGLLSAILAIGLLGYLENIFGAVSVVRLLELSNPSRPLLRRLLTEAPGTYNHSILVGNLAEAAAERIGADSLLARIGAYYHDIGKIKRPYFFIENQFTTENPHEKYSPFLSTLIITSHVKDGVQMAREESLPPKVIDIIEQHHGTTLVQYFYHEAQQQAKAGTIKEEDFRYDGPRPQTKEAAIVMLSDSVEAAVRAMNKPTPGKIEGLVRKIIKERLDSGQLDECDLTLKDLDKVASAFVHVLNGIFHSRIEYPERSIADLERSRRFIGTINK